MPARRIPVTPDRYSYNATTFTLTVNVDGLVSDDGQYLLQIRADGVASASDLAVTLSSGGAVPIREWLLAAAILPLASRFHGR